MSLAHRLAAPIAGCYPDRFRGDTQMGSTDSATFAAWITAAAAITSLAVTVLVQIVFRWLDSRGKRNSEIMQRRRDALFAALQVADHVYANMSWDGKPPPNPHSWDMALAHTAVNEMMLYCKRPDKAIPAFFRAIGIYNPQTQVRPRWGPEDLAKFRSVVSEELGLGKLKYDDPNTTWIGSLAGAKYKECQANSPPADVAMPKGSTALNGGR
jgi:hypothetical protein